MDFFSVAISAGSLALVVVKTVDSIGRFATETAAVPDIIADFHRSVRNLHRALQCVARTFEQAGKDESDTDRKLHPDVFQTLRECRLALDRLQRQLPEISEGPKAIERARASIEMRMRRPVIQALVASIDSYSQILQLTITSLSYGTALDIQQEIVSLRRDMRQASFASLPQYSEVDSPPIPPPGAKQEPESVWPLKEANLSVLSLQTLPSASRSRSGSTTVNLLDDGTTADDEEEDFDPERRENLPSRAFLESALEENLELSNQMSLEGIFDLAASYQKKAIVHREQLARVRHENFPFHEECAMKEQLVELLLGSEGRANISEAEFILQTLLTQEVQQQPGDDERYRRLNHKLGYLCLNLNKLRQAQRFLERAVQGRPGTAPPPPELVLDSLSLLIETLYCKKDYGEARAYARLMPAQVVPDAEEPSVRATTAATLAWCKSRGFDVGSDGFYFHSLQFIDGKDISPIQSAIEAGATDILRQMLECHPSVEVGDEQEAQRPLQMAALKRDRDMVELLLDHRAQGDILDKFGRTILHCCQHKFEGVDVTELIARRLPPIVNVRAKNGRTALFQAVQMENEDSVRVQLARGADPNAGLDLGGYVMSTPLIWVIESKAQPQRKIDMVKLLLEGGADRDGRSSDGKTPWKATERAGLAKVPIRKLLSSAPAGAPPVRVHPPPSAHSGDSGSSSGRSSKKWSFLGRSK